mmetsp:Transcript_32938/g.64840  ORF Transcript_32938/g.64840 Transcript_32938/m.64840 type:complete len:242 (+) Transcript_32938:65-790(+)
MKYMRCLGGRNPPPQLLSLLRLRAYWPSRIDGPFHRQCVAGAACDVGSLAIWPGWDLGNPWTGPELNTVLPGGVWSRTQGAAPGVRSRTQCGCGCITERSIGGGRVGAPAAGGGNGNMTPAEAPIEDNGAEGTATQPNCEFGTPHAGPLCHATFGNGTLGVEPPADGTVPCVKHRGKPTAPCVAAGANMLAGRLVGLLAGLLDVPTLCMDARSSVPFASLAVAGARTLRLRRSPMPPEVSI